MNQLARSLSRLFTVAVAGALVTACVEEPELSGDEQAVWTLLPANVFAPAGIWNGSARSGNDLTATIDCLFGNPQTTHKAFFIAGLKAFREPSSNADNFVARLDVTCTEYGGNPLDQQFDQTGAPVVNSTLYSGSIRNTSGRTALTRSQIPIGIRITKNSSNAYVKDVELLFGTQQWGGGIGYIAGYSSPGSAGTALGLSGTTQDLLCSDQTVLNHLELDFDPSNGKVRSIQLLCTEVLDF